MREFGDEWEGGGKRVKEVKIVSLPFFNYLNLINNLDFSYNVLIRYADTPLSTGAAFAWVIMIFILSESCLAKVTIFLRPMVVPR